MDALKVTGGTNPNGGPSKEFEMMFNKIMNPQKYNKKYGHLEKQKLMPPSYLLKRPRGGKASIREQELFRGNDMDEMKIPLSLYAQRDHLKFPQPEQPKDSKSSYFDSLGKGKSLGATDSSQK